MPHVSCVVQVNANGRRQHDVHIVYIMLMPAICILYTTFLQLMPQVSCMHHVDVMYGVRHVYATYIMCIQWRI